MAGLVGIFLASPDHLNADALGDLARPMMHTERLSLVTELGPWLAGAIGVSSIDHLVVSLTGGASAVVAGLIINQAGSSTSIILQQGVDALRTSTQELARWLDGLDGTFALSIYDPQTSRAVLANDHYGGVPIYLGKRGNDLIWASEVKSVQAVAGGSPSKEALWLFLQNGSLHSKRSYYENIDQLSQGDFVLVDVNSRHIAIHNVLTFVPEPPELQRDLSYEAAKSEFANLLAKAVSRRVAQAGVSEVTVTLSGGLDSRILAAEACRQGLKVTALTYGQEASPELRIARSVASKLNIRHVVVPLNAQNWLAGRSEAVWMTDGMWI